MCIRDSSLLPDSVAMRAFPAALTLRLQWRPPDANRTARTPRACSTLSDPTATTRTSTPPSGARGPSRSESGVSRVLPRPNWSSEGGSEREERERERVG
eukprot:624410-Rhodomonas_salina.1